MCKVLKIHLCSLAQGNHKGLSVEKYHLFLNKTQTIVGRDIGSLLSILKNAKTFQYAWKSSPIDNIDVSQSLGAVGREF